MDSVFAKITRTAIGGLNAQQAVIAVTGNNIANVNTAGYARRDIVLENQVSGASPAGFNPGDGVRITQVRRIADEYLEAILRDTRAEAARLGVEDSFFSRVQQAFPLNDDSLSIGSALTNFVDAIDDLEANPASIPLRSAFIQRGEDLVSTLKSAFQLVADLQTEADQRLELEVDKVNEITTQIASLNEIIVSTEASGSVNPDARDARNVLLDQLSQKLSTQVRENADGSVDITIANGFALVQGSRSQKIVFTTSPTFATTLPNSLNGTPLGHIAIDYGPAGAPDHVDLTQAIKAGSGSMAGLLNLRGYNDPASTSPYQADGAFVAIASRIEAISRQLLTSINSTYIGGDEDTVTAGNQPTSGDLTGTQPSTFGLFAISGVAAPDADGDGIPEGTDLTTLGLDSFTSRLVFNISNPANVAAARDLDPLNGVTSFVAGDGRNMSALGSAMRGTYTFAMGSYSFSGTFGDAYQEMVSYVGSRAESAASSYRVAQLQVTAAETKRDEMSGVSLDEEFAKLIQAQRAFQGAARMIKTADDMIQEILQLV